MPRLGSRAQLSRDIRAWISREKEGEVVGMFYGKPLTMIRGPEDEDEWRRYQEELSTLWDELTKFSMNDLRRLAAALGIQSRVVGRKHNRDVEKQLVSTIEYKVGLGWSVERACRWLARRHYGKRVSAGTLAKRYHRGRKRQAATRDETH
jgi:hypothetical protein